MVVHSKYDPVFNPCSMIYVVGWSEGTKTGLSWNQDLSVWPKLLFWAIAWWHSMMLWEVSIVWQSTLTVKGLSGMPTAQRVPAFLFPWRVAERRGVLHFLWQLSEGREKAGGPSPGGGPKSSTWAALTPVFCHLWSYVISYLHVSIKCLR